MATLNTHVTYNGNCEEAFNFYKSVFGGEFNFLMRNKDIPAEVPSPASAEEAEKIMHISLPLGNGSMLMGCDMPSQYGEAQRPNSFNISIQTDSKEETDKYFNGLAEGGKVTMPLEEAFWGDYFGMCVDKYGVQWMVSNPLK